MSNLQHSTRRQWLQSAGAAALGLGTTLAGPAWAQGSYPDKPIRIIVPLPAGGTPDAAVRMFAEQLQRIVKQTVIVENKPGGLYTLGLQALAAAPADGYTLFHVNVSMATIQAGMHKFDMLKQLVPVTLAGETTAVLTASAKAPFKTAKELIAYAKANPGKLNYSIGGIGSAEHLLCVMMEKAAGFTATAVPFKGQIEAVTALMAGDVDYGVLPTPMALQLMPKGGLQPLAVLSPTHVPQLPGVPTAAEAGVPISPFAYWGGFAVAPGTPAPIVDYLHQALSKAVMAPELRDRMAGLAMVQTVSPTPAAFTALIRSELDRFTAAVKAGNLKFE